MQDTHEVYEAQDGIEAYQVYKENPVELLITDLVMPGKSGIELIMQLMDETPDVRILAISGGDGITGHFDYLPIAKLIGV